MKDGIAIAIPCMCSVTVPDSLLVRSSLEPFGALVGEDNGRQPWFVTRSDTGLVDLALFHDALLERWVWSGRN